jgi:hypothetical protein
LVTSRHKPENLDGRDYACAPEWRVFRGIARLSPVLFVVVLVVVLLVVLLSAWPLAAREKDNVQYGMGLIANVPFPENEVAQVLQDVVQDGIIRGTKEYNKDPYISDAAAAESTKVFPPWKEGGKVFYKVRLKALDPRNFKDSGDVGTLAVRYVVQPQGDKNSVVHIDAVFVEDFRHIVHPSNGSVEGAEYKDIHDRLDAMESIKEQTAEALKEKKAYLAKTGVPSASSSKNDRPAPVAASDAGSESARNDSQSGNSEPTGPQTPEQHLHYLRQQVERLVKSPGAPLKSAPFHTATTLQTLESGTEVLIVVSTPYWMGVETHEGQHGWILRDQLEQVP